MACRFAIEQHAGDEGQVLCPRKSDYSFFVMNIASETHIAK